MDILQWIAFGTLFTVVLCASVFAYIRLKYGFWALQPVFHIYDASYYWNPPGIVCHTLPKANRYTDFSRVSTVLVSVLSPVERSRFVQLIQGNYFRHGQNAYAPKENNILPYLSSHHDKCFVSLYTEPVTLMCNRTRRVIQDVSVLGAITSRPLTVTIRDAGAVFDVYYVDFLCVEGNHRKKGIAPKLIQTHHYNQSHQNPRISVSLFKREGELTGIVPLCAYTTYGFHSQKSWAVPSPLTADYQIVAVNSTNFHLLHFFFKENLSAFSISISCAPSHLLELIQTGNVIGQMFLHQHTILAAYFFYNTCVQIEEGNDVLTCFASVRGKCEVDFFVHGFRLAHYKTVQANPNFTYCAVENISHNHLILDDLLRKESPPVIRSPTAFFFYNFAIHTVSSSSVFFLA